MDRRKYKQQRQTAAKEFVSDMYRKDKERDRKDQEGQKEGVVERRRGEMGRNRGT